MYDTLSAVGVFLINQPQYSFTSEEISFALNLPQSEVFQALIKLKERRAVRRMFVDRWAHRP
jgi:transcription initiation factor IIE alpha subunit